MSAPAHVRRWPASLAVALVLLANLAVPPAVSLGPVWLVPAAQAVVLAPLVLSNPVHLRRDHPLLRVVGVASATAVEVLNVCLLARTVTVLVGGVAVSAAGLVTTGGVVLLTTWWRWGSCCGSWTAAARSSGPRPETLQSLPTCCSRR